MRGQVEMFCDDNVGHTAFVQRVARAGLITEQRVLGREMLEGRQRLRRVSERRRAGASGASFIAQLT